MCVHLISADVSKNYLKESHFQDWLSWKHDGQTFG